MGQLSSVYTDVEASLNEAQQLLNEEQQIERQSQGKRPPSMILKELSLEASRYADAHAKAADSNMLLHKAINSHLSNLKILSLPLSEIQTQLPSLQVSAEIKCLKLNPQEVFIYFFSILIRHWNRAKTKLLSRSYKDCLTRLKRCGSSVLCYTIS